MFKLFDAPWRSLKVTVPPVVGVQVNVAGWPAVRLNVEGSVNGLELLAAYVAAIKPDMVKKVKRMLELM